MNDRKYFAYHAARKRLAKQYQSVSMKTQVHVQHRIETAWPKTKSWGYVPEESDLTLQQCRSRKKNWKKNYPKMKTRIIRTTITIAEIK